MSGCAPFDSLSLTTTPSPKQSPSSSSMPSAFPPKTDSSHAVCFRLPSYRLPVPRPSRFRLTSLLLFLRPAPRNLANERKANTKRLQHTIVGLAPGTYQRGFGQDLDSSVKYKIIQLIASVRTVMRGKLADHSPSPPMLLSSCLQAEDRMRLCGWLICYNAMASSSLNYNQHPYHSLRAHTWLVI